MYSTSVRAVGWHGAPTALTSRCACPTDTSDGIEPSGPSPRHPHIPITGPKWT